MPHEPMPSQWKLPDPHEAPADADELVGVGADLEPGTMLAAYRSGLFPMPLPEEVRSAVGDDISPIGWWSPDPRAILPLDGMIVSRSLRRSCHKFEIRVDSAFQEVVRACGDPSRPHGWIDDDMFDAYVKLFELGWAHSIETWTRDTNTLAGGVFGLAIGAFFSAESMFHSQTDASKAALAGLVALLRERDFDLLDAQWPTDHLASLGVIEISRAEYLERLESAVNGRAEPLDALDKALHL